MSDKPVEGGGGKTPEKDRNLGRDSYSFTNLPDKITRNILRCLRFSDLLNLRAVSKGLLMTVNSLDSRLPGWKMKTYYEANLDDYDDYEDFNNLIIMHQPNKDVVYYESNKDIRVVLTNEFNKHEQDLVQEVGDRVVHLTSPLKVLLGGNKLKRVKNLTTYGYIEYDELDDDEIPYIPLKVFKSMKNLQVLSLENLSIDELKHSKFSLPHLKEISLSDVTELDGLPNLLSSCSTTLEKLGLYLVEMMPGTLKNMDVSLEKLKHVILSGVDIDNLISFISKFSSSLQKLQMYHIKDFYLEHYSKANLIEWKYSFPKLEDLHLERCSQEFLCILKCSTPKLKTVNLNGFNGTILSKSVYDVSSIVSLTLQYNYEMKSRTPNGYVDSGSDLLKILEKTAPNLQELDISNLKYEFKSAVPEFANLQKLTLCNCHPNLETSIVANSPKLIKLTLYKARLNTLKKYQLPQTVKHLEFNYNANTQYWDEFQAVSEHLAMFSTSIQNLLIRELLVFEWKPLNFGLDKLRKLTLQNVRISEFENLLQACQSTLEELEIYNCYGHLVLDEMTFKMRVLKNLLVECNTQALGKEEAVITRLNTVHNLVCNCPYLEKLVLGIQGLRGMNKSDLTHLQYCYLPNLKIVQVYPKPTDENIKLIKDTFSNNVTYWFFPVPNATDYLPGLRK